MAGWRGGACGGGVPLRPPGRPPESGLARANPAWRKRLSRLCVAQRAIPQAVSLPALDYAGAVSESALRRDGEGRSPMDPMRATGSVGRGVKSSRLCGTRVFVRAGNRGNPAGRGWKKGLRTGTGPLARRDGGDHIPATGGATFPRGIGGVTASMPVGPFAPESKTGVPKIAERGAPGRHPSLTKAPTARRSAPPVFIYRTTRAKAAGSRGHAGDLIDPSIH